MFPAFENSLVSDPASVIGLMVAGLLADHVLVACRLTGLLVTIPGLNGATLPWHLKCLLIVVTAAVITPNVSTFAKPANEAAQAHGRIARNSESGIQLASHAEWHWDGSMAIDDGSPLSTGRSRAVSVLNSGLDFLVAGVSEVCLGLVLGLGANLILQGFRMAGQLIDQQTGWGLITATSSAGDDAGTAAGALFYWLGAVLLLTVGGHLLLISTLLETFRSFPPGTASVSVEVIPAVSQLVQQSLSLALQLSAPLLATQFLAGQVLSYAGTVAPQFQQSGTAAVVRLVLASLILVVTLNGMTDRLIESIPVAMETVSSVFGPVERQ